MSVSYKLSLGMQEIISKLDKDLEQITGDRITFVLIMSADNVAQYASNATREDGIDLLKSLLKRWEAKKADIPAHYNPDLKGIL